MSVGVGVGVGDKAKAKRRSSLRGGSLLEVLMALAFVAIATSAALANQLFAARTERVAAQRERASLIAASVADAMREPLGAETALAHWRTHAAAFLPQGEVALDARGPDIAFAVVRWAPGRAFADGRFAQTLGCPPTFFAPERACVVAPVLR